MRKKELRRQIETLKDSVSYWTEETMTARQRARDLQRTVEQMRVALLHAEQDAMELAKWLMGEWVYVHEKYTDEVDLLLKPYVGRLVNGTV